LKGWSDQQLTELQSGKYEGVTGQYSGGKVIAKPWLTDSYQDHILLNPGRKGQTKVNSFKLQVSGSKTGESLA
jgi:hypothetical protein